jgi:predicted membrane chloride channel (bestrophin family)
VSDVLLTVLGFVVGLALSFRTSASYERYSEGRKYWASLQLASHNLSRAIWTHAREREGELGKEDLLAKITGLNLVVAFAVALKHRLRYEPYTHYEDLHGLVGHLQTFAKAATTLDVIKTKKHSVIRQVGQYLGVSFAEANPRKVLKRSAQPLGNLPLEILSYLGSYLDELCQNGNLKQSMHQVSACTLKIFSAILLH